MAAAKPIDFVVPIVNHKDVAWRKDFFKAIMKAGLNQYYAGSRWRNWGIDRYIFRSVAENMPWVRKVHVLVSRESQIPAWLDTSKVNVVLHKDFMPAKHLPTFNSQAFEMYLSFIPDLAEQFIYSNDDFFALSPLKRTDFFRFGKPCLHHDERYWSPLDSGIFRHVCRSGLQLVAAHLGVDMKGKWLKYTHGMSPMLKSTHEKVWEQLAPALDNSPTPFRSKRNYNQYIFNYWQVLTGAYVDYTPPVVYRETGGDIDELCRQITEGKGVLVLNDSKSGEEWIKPRGRIREAFATRFPEKCKYEL